MENQNLHHRRSIRLPGYDYSEPGGYFITIVTHQREHLFGVVTDGEMRLNPLGEIVRDEWMKTPVIRPNVELGEFVVMPNHLHAIVEINDDPPMGTNANLPVGAYCNTPLRNDQHRFQSPSQTIGAIVRGYKSAVTKRINEYRDTLGHPVWQRNYYEHIIRSDEDHAGIDAYITSNPANWNSDDENI